MFIEVTLASGEKKEAVNSDYIIAFAPSRSPHNPGGTMILRDQVGAMEVKEDYNKLMFLITAWAP